MWLWRTLPKRQEPCLFCTTQEPCERCHSWCVFTGRVGFCEGCSYTIGSVGGGWRPLSGSQKDKFPLCFWLLEKSTFSFLVSSQQVKPATQVVAWQRKRLVWKDIKIQNPFRRPPSPQIAWWKEEFINQKRGQEWFWVQPSLSLDVIVMPRWEI